MRGRGLRSCREPAHLTQEQLPLSDLSRTVIPSGSGSRASSPRESSDQRAPHRRARALGRPEVSVVDVGIGVTGTVVGHDGADGRRVVTQPWGPLT